MINYSEDWIIPLIFRLKGSVAVRASLFAVPAAVLCLLLVFVDDWKPDLRKELGLLDAKSSQLWAASTAVLSILLGFRTNRAMARFWEGTGLLHQMRGEWFDSVSCCVTFSRGAVSAKRDDVMNFRHTIVRLMSLCHGSALEEIAGSDAEECETIDSFGLDNTTLHHLKACKEEFHFNRVEVLLHLIQSLITKNLDDGILKIPPPILSRVYQTLSRGFVNLLNAKKIADTRFPFPYVQLITMLLIINVGLTPMMISALIDSKVWAPVFTFVPIFGMFSLNFIGVELENPFGSDDNDLPLDHFQAEMNNCLLMLLQENADLIAGVSKTRCIKDFNEIAARFRHDGESSDADAMGRMASKRVSQFADHIDLLADEAESAQRLTQLSQGAAESTSVAAAATSPAPAAAAPEPAPPPVPVALAKSIEELNRSLSELKKSVETQATDLGRSIAAVDAFRETLPKLLGNMTAIESSGPGRGKDRPDGFYQIVNGVPDASGGADVLSRTGSPNANPNNKPSLCGPVPSVQVSPVKVESLENLGKESTL